MRTIIIATVLSSLLIASFAVGSVCAGPTMQIEPLPVNEFRVYDGEWQAVARFRMTFVPDPEGEQHELELYQVVVRDNAPVELWDLVLGVAFAIDENRDGKYTEGVDPLVQGIDPSGPNINDMVTQPNGVVRLHANSGRGNFSHVGKMANWFGGNGGRMPIFRTGYQEDWLLLYRVAPEAGIDATFEPYFPNSTGGSIWIWSALNERGWVDPILREVTEDPSIINLGPVTIDLNRWVVIDNTTGEETPLPDDFDPESLLGIYGDIILPPYQIEGLLVEGNTPVAQGPVLPGATGVVVGDVTMTGYNGDDSGFTPEGMVIEVRSGDPRHYAGVTVVHDVNNTGAYEAGIDVVLARRDEGFPAGSVEMTIEGAPIALRHLDTARLLVLADFNENVKIEMAYSLGITGLSAHGDRVTGAPIDFTPVIGGEDRHPKLSVALEGDAGTRAEAGETDALAGTIRIDTIDVNTGLLAVVLRATGTGLADRDISQVRLVADVNGNAVLDDQDLMVAAGVFGAREGSLRLELDGTTRLSTGGRTRLFVVFAIAETAERGSTFGFTLEGIETADSVPVEGEGGESGTVTVGSESDDDPEFDPTPIGPFNVLSGGTVGCAAAGIDQPMQILVWTALVLGLVIRRRR